MRFSDIPQLTTPAHYRVNQSWYNMEEALNDYMTRKLCPLDINPEFQRGHVWTEEQQRKYVEYKLQGGEGANIISFNCIGWMNSFKGPFVLVDGKQRLAAVLKFKRNELFIFKGLYYKTEGYLYRHFSDRLGSLDPDFIFCVNNLKSMKDVYRWYVEMNCGGTPHTEDEINKVRKMIEEYDVTNS